MTLVELTPYEEAVCQTEAEARSSGALIHRRRWTNGERPPEDEARRLELLGARGEYAAAMALGLTHELRALWAEQKGPQGDGPDIPPDIEVKTGSLPHHNLLIPAGDIERLGKRYILVVANGSSLYVVGWVDSPRARLVGVLKEPVPGRPCVLVRQADLYPIETLHVEILQGKDLEV